jgi:diguanylate cyclase (GGDEF)-like protein
MRELNQIANSIISGLHDAAVIINPALMIIGYNTAFVGVAGIRQKDLAEYLSQEGGVFQLIGTANKVELDCFRHCLEEKRMIGLAEVAVKNIIGNEFTVWISFIPVIDYQGDVLSIIEVIRDVSAEARMHARFKELQTLTIARAKDLEQLVARRTHELEAALAEVMRLSRIDPLTEQLNRRAFCEEAERFLELAKRYNRMAAIIMCDLDHFKSINDLYGHQVGDTVLKHFAKEMARVLRKTDAVGRFGGEEFIILLSEISSVNVVPAIQRIKEAVENIPYADHIPGFPQQITASFGIALFPVDGTCLDKLIHRADQALYMAKNEGRNRYKFYQYSFEQTDNLSSSKALALSTKNALVAIKDFPAQKVVKQAISATGARVSVLSGPPLTPELLDQPPPDLLFLDWDNIEILPELIKINPLLHAVLITPQPIFQESGLQMLKLPLSSIFITNFSSPLDVHNPLCIQEIVATAAKLLTNDIFGLEKYLNHGAAIYEITITESEQRYEAVNQIYQLATQCDLGANVGRKIKVLADELMMNAIFDAPVDPGGKPRYADCSRTIPLKLLPQETVKIRYGSDANYFGISVIDNFGQLQYERAVSYLKNCFAGKGSTINTGPGGAGLGLYMAYNVVSSFIINVSCQQKTEVIGLIHLNRHHRRETGDGRSFYYFKKMGLPQAKMPPLD